MKRSTSLKSSQKGEESENGSRINRSRSRKLSRRLSRTFSQKKEAKNKADKSAGYGFLMHTLDSEGNISRNNSRSLIGSLEELNSKVEKEVMTLYYNNKDFQYGDILIFKAKNVDSSDLTYTNILSSDMPSVNICLRSTNIYIITNYPEFSQDTVRSIPFICGFKAIANHINSLNKDELLDYIEEEGYDRINTNQYLSDLKEDVIKEHLRNINIPEEVARSMFTVSSN